MEEDKEEVKEAIRNEEVEEVKEEHKSGEGPNFNNPATILHCLP